MSGLPGVALRWMLNPLSLFLSASPPNVLRALISIRNYSILHPLWRIPVELLATRKITTLRNVSFLILKNEQDYQDYSRERTCCINTCFMLFVLLLVKKKRKETEIFRIALFEKETWID